MVEGVRIYIEGDKKNKTSNISLREGFSVFFDVLREKARERKIKFDIILCGSSAETFRDFQFGVRSHPNSFVTFLIDSDDELDNQDTPKSFLQKQTKSKNWEWRNVEDEQCHLMIQIMESWLIADIETLKNYYGKDFHANSIPKNKNIEKVPKLDVENSLAKATKDTKKGVYHKVKHGAELLTKVNKEIIKLKSKHCQLIFDTIKEKIDEE